MTKEDQYKQQLIDLGVYHPAYDGEIHTLCTLERELSRAMKSWKATAPSKNDPPDPTSPLYEVIQKQRRDILQHRDALGLTPKAMQRLRRQAIHDAEVTAPVSGNAAFAELLDQFREAAADG